MGRQSSTRIYSGESELSEFLCDWFNPDEKTPHDGQRVLTYCGDFAKIQGDHFWLMGCTIFRDGRFHASGLYKITHWMPAPKSPDIAINDLGENLMRSKVETGEYDRW